MEPRISVIIPVYNCEGYLRDCLDSILNQDMHEIEIICADDGSTDKSLEILREYAERDSRIVALTKEQGGASSARNLCLSYAKGEYLHFVDSDDVLAEGVYRELYETVTRESLDLIYFEADTRFENEELEHSFANRKNVYEKKNDYYGVYKGISFFCEMKRNGEYTPVPWLFLVRKSLLDKYNIRFYEDIPVHNDNPFTYMVLTKANRVGFLKKCCYHRRIRPNSLSTNPVNYKNPLGYALSLYYIFMDYAKANFDQEEKKVIREYIENTILKCMESEYWRLDDEQRELFDSVNLDAEKRLFLESFVIPKLYYRNLQETKEDYVRLGNSISYKIGRMITFVPRKMRKVIRKIGAYRRSIVSPVLLDRYEIELTYETGRLTCIVYEKKESKSNVEFAYYLYDAEDGFRVGSGYSKSKRHTFLMDGYLPGRQYYVKVFIRSKYDKKMLRTNMIFVARDEYDAFDALLAKDESFEAELPFWKSQYPYQDILIAYSKRSELLSSIKEYIIQEEFQLKTIDTNTIIAAETLSDSAEYFCFSGIARNKDRLIFGQKDIESLENVQEIIEQVGNFCLVRKKNNRLLLQNDYFGISKTYYYVAEDAVIISNRYHLIINCMNSAGIERQPNKQKISAGLSITNQLFMQNFTREMNIKNTFVLPIDSMLILDTQNGRIKSKKTSIFKELSHPKKYDPRAYKETIELATSEILDNARIALESDHFEKYVVDITGGMDSRMVFAALSCYPEYYEMIFPHTVCGSKYVGDFNTAIEVVAKSNIHFKKLVCKDVETRDLDREAMSCVLGVTSEYSTFMNKHDKVCELPGFYGETTGRPYYTGFYYDTEMMNPSLSQHVFYKELVCGQDGRLFDDVESLSELMMKECVSLPGRSNIEKYENHYLYYRNGIHFEDIWRSSLSGCHWGILQSKALFRAKYMLYPRDGIRPQLDVLYRLNPYIAGIRFSNEEYEKQREKLNQLYDGIYLVADKLDSTIIEETKREYKDSLNRIQYSPITDFSKYFQTNTIVQIIAKLVKRNIISKQQGFDIYIFFKKSESDSMRKKNAVKIVSLYFELF